MADSTQQQNKTAWLWWFPPARWLAEYSAAWLPGDIVAGITLAAYAIPVSLAYAGLAGLPPQAGIYGYLLGGLGYALLGILASARRRSHFRDLADDCGDGRSHGGGGCATLRTDRQPRGLHRGCAQPVRLAVAAERAGEADQRQRSCGFQGRRRPDDCHDAAAEPVRREGRGPQFFRTGVRCSPGSSVRCNTSFSSSGLSRSCCSYSANACCRENRSRSGLSRCRSLPRRCWGFRRLGCLRREKYRQACPAWQARLSGCATSRESFRWPRVVCCWPISRAYLRPAPSLRSMDTRWIPDKNYWASVRPISQRRWATAIPVAGGLSQSAVNDKAGARTSLALVFASITLALCLLFLTGLLRKSAEGSAGSRGVDRSVWAAGFSGAAPHVASEPAGFPGRSRSRWSACCFLEYFRASCSPHWPPYCCCSRACRAHMLHFLAACPAPTAIPTWTAIPRTSRCLA